MAEFRCPNCGNEIPVEAGQHALTPISGLVECPHCGAEVTLERPWSEPEAQASDEVERAEAAPPGRTEGRESFAGEETAEGVMDELEEKEGGPR